jgi:hypothetical protein
MKIKTRELVGDQLDWAVAYCRQGYDPRPVRYSSDWQYGGPIIEQERIQIIPMNGAFWESGLERAMPIPGRNARGFCHQAGPTGLIAAMRCYVASRLGDEVEIPEEIA